MSSSNGTEGQAGHSDGLQGETMQASRSEAASAARRGTPEGRYVGGSGKSLYRQVTDQQAQRSDATVTVQVSQEGVKRAEATDLERKDAHRGGDRTWLLRGLIPLCVLSEAVTAYVAMEVLVASIFLAEALSALTALIGGGMACIFANRRLNRHSIPVAARILEGIFVAVITVLRYQSLHVQGAGNLTAVGAAGLAALISALALLGIEEIVVETRTSAIFLSTLRVSWKRWRLAAAKRRLARIQAQIEATARKLQQHFLEFLLKVEGMPLDQARQHAAALKAALIGRES